MTEIDRKEKILNTINLKGNGLELGPLCWPLLSKSEANIQYVDHVSKPELLKVYKNDPGVPPELIPEVDYPLNGRSLRDAIPDNKTFDYIIASHVIEHIPDMVRWFKELSSVLKVGGIVSFAIPDKRYTFDIDRRPSEISDVMGAYIDKLTRPSSSTVFNYASHFRLNIDAKKIWNGELYLNSKAPHKYSLVGAVEETEKNKRQYVDTHCFVFTPYSFFSIIKGLIELDLFDFTIASFYPTAVGEYEFIVSIKKAPRNISQHARRNTVPTIAKEPAFDREYEARIKKLTSDLNSTQLRLSQIEQELQNTHKSLAWKSTKPLRFGLHNSKKVARKILKRQ